MDRRLNLFSINDGRFKRPASNNDNRQMRDENLPRLSNSPDHPVTAFPIMPPPFDIEQIPGTFLNSPLKRQKSSDMDVIPLCQFHHTGGFSIHMNKKAFEAKYGSEERLLKKVKEYMEAVYA